MRGMIGRAPSFGEAAADAEAVEVIKQGGIDNPVEPQVLPMPPLPLPAMNVDYSSVGGQCGAGTYRSSAILWSCESPTAAATFRVSAGEKVAALLVPAGVKNLEVRLTPPQVALQVSNINGDVILGSGAATSVAQPGGLDIRLDRTSGNEVVRFRGDTSDELILSLDNLAAGLQAAEATLLVQHEGLATCPASPIGCRPYNATAAANEVHDWACLANREFPTASSSWEAVGAVHAEAGGIPWLEFGDVWDPFTPDSTGSSETRWMAAFRHLDQNDDMRISETEFERGYAACATSAGASSMVTLVGFIVAALLVGACVWIALRSSGGEPSVAPEARYREEQEHEGYAVAAPDPEEPALQQAAARLQAPPGAQRSCGGLLNCASWRGKVGAESWPQPPPQQPYALDPTYMPIDREHALEPDPREEYHARLESRQAQQHREIEELQSQLQELHHTHDVFGQGDVSLHARKDYLVEPSDDLQATIECLRRPGNALAHVDACQRLVAWIRCEDDEGAAGAERRKSQAIHAGVVPAVVQSMNQGTYDHALQISGCAALRVLCAGDGAENELAFAVGQGGGADAVMQAMHMHPSQNVVQREACRALKQMALHSANRQRIIRGHGMELISSSMRAHMHSDALLEGGCLALSNVAFEPASAGHITMELMQTVVLAMQQHRDSIELQEAAIRAIYNMLYTSPGMFDSFVELGGVNAVGDAMRRHTALGGDLDAKAIWRQAHGAESP